MSSSRNFKPGDVVVCIRGTGNITPGTLLTVSDISEGLGAEDPILKFKEIDARSYHFSSHFAPAKSHYVKQFIKQLQ